MTLSFQWGIYHVHRLSVLCTMLKHLSTGYMQISGFLPLASLKLQVCTQDSEKSPD